MVAEGLQVVELSVAKLAVGLVHDELAGFTELSLLQMLLHFWLSVESLLG